VEAHRVEMLKFPQSLDNRLTDGVHTAYVCTYSYTIAKVRLHVPLGGSTAGKLFILLVVHKCASGQLILPLLPP
jgi:hypothetical protein